MLVYNEKVCEVNLDVGFVSLFFNFIYSICMYMIGEGSVLYYLLKEKREGVKMEFMIIDILIFF